MVRNGAIPLSQFFDENKTLLAMLVCENKLQVGELILLTSDDLSRQYTQTPDRRIP